MARPTQEPDHRQAGTGFAVLGWLGIVVGGLVILLSVLSAGTALPATGWRAVLGLDFGGGLIGGGVALVAFGAVVARLEVLCFYARAADWERQRDRRPAKAGAAAAEKPPGQRAGQRIGRALQDEAMGRREPKL